MMQIKWAELIPTMCGYAVPLNDDKEPCLYDSENEVIEEIEEMHDLYQEQIEAGERDDNDEYEGEIFRVFFDGYNLYTIDEHDKPIMNIEWRQ